MRRFKFKRFRVLWPLIPLKVPTIVGLLIFTMLGSNAKAQEWSSLRSRALFLSQDSLRFDSLSIDPNSFSIQKSDGTVPDSAEYELDAAKSTLIWKGTLPKDSLYIRYRTLSLDLSKPYFKRSTALIQPEEEYFLAPITYSTATASSNVFGSSQLNKTGSISRGIGFGNNQDLNVNSTLSLQLSGKLTENINVLASVTDDNIPIQPEGNTAQLQEFDQVFIQLYDDKSKLTAGDFIVGKPVGYFANYFKRAQGASFETRQPLGTGKNTFFTRTSAAVSRGKFARNIIQGVEGNQGPYRLRGNEGETFIIILAGTERVFIDGRPLKRGQEFDYVIDYNTAEITFTANQLINKDKRIAIEFQYTAANYVRTMFETSTGIESENYNVYVNFYTEQDSKNQPLQQELDETDRVILSEVGDDIFNAVAPGFSPVDEFDNSSILYELIDSLGYDSVFVRASGQSGNLFRVSFSEVGQGNGDYIQAGFDATGRVFEWVAPDTLVGLIVRQGNYAPVRLLVAPQKSQLLMVGGNYKFTEKTKAFVEAGFSNYDLNTFSEIGNQNNVSHGIFASLEHVQPLSKNKNPLNVKGSLAFESIGNNFQPIEPYRSVEFNRNWNLSPEMLGENQDILTGGLGIFKGSAIKINYNVNRFTAGDLYTGLKNGLEGSVNLKGFDAIFDGSILETSGIEESRFSRHRSKVEKSVWITKVGFEDERENNMRFRPNTDSLTATAYKFYDWQVYLTNPDTSKLGYKVFYRERTDFASDLNEYQESTHATHYGADFSFLQNPRNTFKAGVSNRVLEIIDEELTDQAPERTILGRFEHGLRLAKNSFTSNIYYEVGSGLERRQEFIYISDPTGQGPFTWIDYNNNGLKELNEFEIARPEDGDRYIRVFTPTDNYERAYSNQYSHTININPAGLWADKKGFLKGLSKFSNQTAFRVQRKTRQEEDAQRFNPFAATNDSVLISQSSSLRNTLFFNRTGSKFGVDYTYSEQVSVNPLTTGFERRENISNILRIRYNLTSKYSIVLEQEEGKQKGSSDVIDGRNFIIDYFTLKQTFSYQPGTDFRVSLTNNFTKRNNQPHLGGEVAEILDLGADFRLSKIEAGTIFAQVNYITIDYSGEDNNTLAYQMLDGLRNGENITWGAGIQRNLGKNMQLSLSYNGRKSETVKAVHTGNMQVRAFF